MKMTFRWYGEDDPVTLDKIRQIPGMTGVVSAVYSVKPGGVWSDEAISALKAKAEEAGLEFEVVESVPVCEDIKLGNENAQKYIDNYCENVRRLGKAGVKVICYNFMPVFDWLRSDLKRQLWDGSNALAYDHAQVLAMDPSKTELSLPGWDESYTKQEMQKLLDSYKSVDEEKLWENLTVFLKQVIPVAEESGVKMAIHPDDPPWGIFGLPRIITNKENLKRFINIVDSPSNGVTFCTGSLGANPDNDLCDMIKMLKGKIPFAHIRNVKHLENHGFEETGHLSRDGSLDIYAILKALKDTGFDGYIRPDHGRMIWGETGRPGYGLYDRALGAAYINGIWESLLKEEK